ncbi:MAG: hypothetical protein R2744_09095 [Bacteroidales bacterium]
MSATAASRSIYLRGIAEFAAITTGVVNSSICSLVNDINRRLKRPNLTFP